MPKSQPIPGEAWRLLPDAEGRYQVSDCGRIRSLVAGSRSGTVPRKRPLLMSPYDNGRGYLVINLKLSIGYRCYGISELVLRTFVGPRPAPHYQAAHSNGRRRDNRRQNLRWATPKENDADKDRHGTRRLRPRRLLDGVEQLRCTRCGLWLARDCFRPVSRAGRTRNGASSWCRPCENTSSREGKRRRRAAGRPARRSNWTPSPEHVPSAAVDAGEVVVSSGSSERVVAGPLS